MLPFFYTVKNLQREPGRTVQIILGAFAVVLLVMLSLSFDSSMNRMLDSTGNPNNVILLSTGSTESLQRSSIPGEASTVAAATPGVVKGDRPRVSTEVHCMTPVIFPGGQKGRAYIRGIGPEAFTVHDTVRLTDGRLPKPGEILVGELTYHALGVDKADVALGKTITLGGAKFRISGHFAAPNTRYESEIWGDRSDILALTKRENPSCVIATTEGKGAKALQNLAFRRSDLELAAVSETKYYEDLAKFFGPIVTITWLSALLVAIGALFGGFNTLYAAFGSRTRELAALQAMGFTRMNIFCSLLIEALLSCMLGTLLACVLCVFIFSDATISLSAGTLTLHFDAATLIYGMLTGVGLGLIGAALPAWSCLRVTLPTALRSI